MQRTRPSFDEYLNLLIASRSMCGWSLRLLAVLCFPFTIAVPWRPSGEHCDLIGILSRFESLAPDQEPTKSNRSWPAMPWRRRTNLSTGVRPPR